MTDDNVNLAALASNPNMKKPSKKEAQQICKDVAAKWPDAGPDLARLYAYFMPPKPKRPRDSWAWVALAVANQYETRDYLRYIAVTEQHITASDGHRLHRAPNVGGLAPGYYLTNGDKAYGPGDMTYPDLERVIPPTDPLRIVRFEKEPHRNEPDAGKIWYVWLIAGRYAVNADYFLQATAGAEYPLDIQLPQPERYGTGAARVDFPDGRLAVIMPIRVQP